MNQVTMSNDNGATTGKRVVDRTTAGVLARLSNLDEDLRDQARHVYFSSRWTLRIRRADHLFTRLGEDQKVAAEGWIKEDTLVSLETLAYEEEKRVEKSREISRRTDPHREKKAEEIKALRQERDQKISEIRRRDDLTPRQREERIEACKWQCQGSIDFIRSLYNTAIAEDTQEVNTEYTQTFRSISEEKRAQSSTKTYVSDRMDDLSQTLVTAVLEARTLAESYGDQVRVAKRILLREVVRDYRQTATRRRWVSLDEEAALEYLGKLESSYDLEDEVLAQLTDREKIQAWSDTARHNHIAPEIISSVVATTEEQQIVAEIKQLEQAQVSLSLELAPLRHQRERMILDGVPLLERAGVVTAIKTIQRSQQRNAKKIQTLYKKLEKFN